ncbi:MAG TPA: hypothetical protein VHP56_07975 [Solirubrobacterales bacterium]|nr:hypothetical protein [Solirubrobacterales bacterium]
MKLQQTGNAQGLEAFVPHQSVEGIGIACKLPLAAIAKARRLRAGEALRPVRIYLDALDRVRGRDRLDLRLLRKPAQQFGHLIFVQLLSATAPIDAFQNHAQGSRHSGESPIGILKAPHCDNYLIK